MRSISYQNTRMTEKRHAKAKQQDGRICPSRRTHLSLHAATFPISAQQVRRACYAKLEPCNARCRILVHLTPPRLSLPPHKHTVKPPQGVNSSESTPIQAIYIFAELLTPRSGWISIALSTWSTFWIHLIFWPTIPHVPQDGSRHNQHFVF